MTKFITFYNLFPIPDPKEFLGIAADYEEGNVINTVARNIVVVLNLSTQKQVRSWSTLEKLSSKVVFDRNSGQYVGVFANQALRLWTIDTPDLNKVKKLKFQKSIAELISNGDDTLVLFSDGRCELLSTALESRKEQQETSQTIQKALIAAKTFSDASVNTLPNGQQILTYFERNHETGDILLVCLNLRTTKYRRYPIKRENVQLAGYTVITNGTVPMLLTIWSDRRIFLINIDLQHTAGRFPGNFVSTLTELNLEHKISILGVSPNFVAIYGANHGQEGASLLLYNTQFKVVKAKQFFKVYFSRLWATKEHILLAMGQHISVVSYRISKELLAELLGTQNNDENLNPIELDNINEEEILEQSIKYVAGNPESAVSIFNENGVQKNSSEPIIADGNTIPFESVDAFEKELNNLSRLTIHAELFEVEQAPEDLQLLIMSNHNDTGSRHALVQQIVRQMERCGASEHEISEKLLNVLIKADQGELVLETLQRYNNISEKILARALSFALKKAINSNLTEEKSNLTNGKLKTSKTKQKEKMDVDVAEDSTCEYPIIDLLAPRNENSKPNLLNTVLACSFDPNAIVEHLRNEVDYKQVAYLLQHLYDILTDTETFLISTNCYIPECVHTENQLLSWFGVILSSHFQELALTKDVKLMELLLKWQLLFNDYYSELGNLENVSACLYNIVQHRKVQTGKNFSKWYSVEEVVLY